MDDDLERVRVRLLVGDLDKPFHLPECECAECESWRWEQGRPTREDLRDSLAEG